MKGRSLFIFVVVLLWGWIGALSVWASRERARREEIHHFSGFYPLLNKRVVRVVFDARTRPNEIVVRVEGLRVQ